MKRCPVCDSSIASSERVCSLCAALFARFAPEHEQTARQDAAEPPQNRSGTRPGVPAPDAVAASARTTEPEG